MNEVIGSLFMVGYLLLNSVIYIYSGWFDSTDCDEKK